MKGMRGLLNNRRATGLIAVNMLLILLTVVAFNAMVDARENALDRAADVTDCQRAADTIESLQTRDSGRPIVSTNSYTDMTRRIDDARGDAALNPTNIQAIDPQSPLRLGNSTYSEMSTQIQLIDVSLKQTLSFIASLCPTDSGLRLTAFHLDSHLSESDFPQSDNRKWAAELTVASTSAAQLQPSEANKP